MKHIVIAGKPVIEFSFNLRLFVLLVLTFILFTVIGTLSHEGGHWIVATAQGKRATINYMSMRTLPSERDSIEERLFRVQDKYIKELRADQPFPGRDDYERGMAKIFSERQWVRAGGPLQTILTGTIGLLLILYWRTIFLQSQQLKVWQWLLVFLSLFWLRQLCNFVVFLAAWVVVGKPSLRMDEISLEAHLALPPFSIIGSTAIIALLVALIVIFRFIPLTQRFTFILSGLVGGCLGYYLWLELLGPVIMP